MKATPCIAGVSVREGANRYVWPTCQRPESDELDLQAASSAVQRSRCRYLADSATLLQQHMAGGNARVRNMLLFLEINASGYQPKEPLIRPNLPG